MLKRNFRADKPNTIWRTDFTYIHKTDGTMRYNCAIIDLYNRAVVATITGKEITSELALQTLKNALRFQIKIIFYIQKNKNSL